MSKLNVLNADDFNADSRLLPEDQNQDVQAQAEHDDSGDQTLTWWRSLDEKEQTEASRALAEVEFANLPESVIDLSPTAQDTDGAGGFERREALKLMGASLALAGLGSACVRRPDEKIVPYVKQPEHIVPGVSRYFATAVPSPQGGFGVLAESHTGRPTKLEGNPDHPMSGGKMDFRTQASVLDLYDPARTRTPLQKGKLSTWEAFDKDLAKLAKAWRGNRGKGLAIVTDGAESHTRDRLLAKIHDAMPQAKLLTYDPRRPENTILGAEFTFGGGARVSHDLSRTQRILAVDSDFLTDGPEHIRHAAAFAAGRNASRINSSKDAGRMNRLYVAEAAFSTTGANADNRIRVASSEAGAFLAAVAKEVFKSARVPANFGGDSAARAVDALAAKYKATDPKFIPEMVTDLVAQKGRAVVLVGERQPAAVHAIGHLINAALGGFSGAAPVCSVSFPAAPDSKKANAFFASLNASRSKTAEGGEGGATENEEAAAAGGTEAADDDNAHASLAGHWAFDRPSELNTSAFNITALVDGINKKTITDVLLLNVNPAYTAPAALKVGDALKNVRVVHVGHTADESAHYADDSWADWHVAHSHYLESWGDTVAWDGTVSLVQPLIAPLHGSRSTIEILAVLANEKSAKGYDLVQTTWRNDLSTLASGKAWSKALHDGVLGDKARRTVSLSGGTDAFSRYAGARMQELVKGVGGRIQDALSKMKAPALSKDSIEVLLSTGGALQDGRSANNAWVQELPDSMTKLVWDNALLVGPALAKELNVTSKVDRNAYSADVVTVTSADGKVDLPVFVVPGYAPYSAMVLRGYGRTRCGSIGNGVGIDVAPLLPKDGSAVATGVKVAKTGKVVTLAGTQDHFTVDQIEPHRVGLKGKKEFEGLGSRPLVRSASVDGYKEKPRFAQDAAIGSLVNGALVQPGFAKNNPTAPDRPIQLTKEVKGFDYSKGQQWGLVFDLTACTGCNACVIACQAENNIPSVGRDSVLMGREMHWIRLDRYYSGDVEEPQAIQQAVACMHCENAPCEPVCPVAATVHDTEGLNSMVYNRCIGTRYCANNCPVKVRRFNYFDFSGSGNLYVEPEQKNRWETMKLQRNPDVTVRYRGVIEKCSYCVQRISEAKIRDKRNGGTGKNLPDGAIVPACQQTCPSEAITFGNINDKKSRVATAKRNERNYEMLSELNIRPRTTYLGQLRNPNTKLAKG